jgi:hypothetical protein
MFRIAPWRLLPTLSLLTAVALWSCGSTRVVTTWQAPALQPLVFTKVLALALAPEESLRRIAEEDLCRQVESVPCKPAYLAISPSEMGDVEKMKAIVKRSGFDGALVFRVVSAREKVSYVPPTHGPTFWGYYGYAHPMAYDPGCYRTDQIVRVEVSIYSISEDRLLWVATTDTTNPRVVDEVVEDVAAAVRRELRRAELVPGG